MFDQLLSRNYIGSIFKAFYPPFQSYKQQHQYDQNTFVRYDVTQEQKIRRPKWIVEQFARIQPREEAAEVQTMQKAVEKVFDEQD